MARIARCPALLAVSLFLLLSACHSRPELVWNEERGYRWAALEDWDGTAAGFEEISGSRTGVTFVNTLREESLLQNRHYMNGSGVAVGDVDGDGWTDLYFARLDGPNVLYRNLGGWRFEEVTEEAGVAAPDRFSTGAVFADIDGDQDLDLLVTAMGGPNAVYLNDGSGRFTDVTEEAGLSSSLGGTTMALADIDGDQDLDLYVANYKVRAVNDIYSPAEHSFDRTVVRDGEGYRIAPEFQEHYALSSHAGGLLRVEKAEPNLLYQNDGSGRFTPISLTDGAFLDENGDPLVEAPLDWSLVARFQDANGDGIPDLYVCNDFQSPDYFWIGDGAGRFRAIPSIAVRKTSFSTMSVDFSDIERDGDLDFFLTDMLSRDHVRRQTQVGLTIPMTTAVGEIDNRPQAVQNSLQLNRGDGTYAEIARAAGVAASDWTWSGLFLDVDLDGYEDLLLATGHLYDVIDKDAQMQEIYSQTATGNTDAFRARLLEYPPLPLQNVAFRNNGDRTFEHVPDGWGFGPEPDVSNALAFGDFDNDGDLDAVVNRLNDSAGLFRNDAAARRLAVRLRGVAPNTQAVGAKIRITGGGLPPQEKEVVSGGIYLSGSDPLYSFAVRDEQEPVTIHVTWRDGSTSTIDSLRANRIVEIDQASIAATPPDSSGMRETSDTTSDSAYSAGPQASIDRLFEDMSDNLGHVHQDTPFDDMQRQPLLRKRLGQLGPGTAWTDFDGDGDDDLVIGAGRGGGVSIYRNDGNGGFSVAVENVVADKTADDVGAVVAHPTENGARLFAGLSNYEGTAGDTSWVYVIDLNRQGSVVARERLPFGRGSVGPLVLADIDNDGDLDLFAGGRTTPGGYPAAPPSRVYINDRGSFQADASRSGTFHDAGMVSGAAFGDLDGDNDADLLLAVEWGPLRYYENDGSGYFAEQTSSVGLDDFYGWWSGLTLGDFDEDGRLDIAATNWGWNSEHERLHAADPPVRLYSGDFNSDGSREAIEAVYDPRMESYVPLQGMNALSETMAYISQRIPSYRKYAESSLREIVGFRLDQAAVLEANTLSSMVFLNRVDNGSEAGTPREGRLFFEADVLPFEAQLSPAFASVVADFDGDGHDDLFLSQNFFAHPMEVPRQDAGRGLLLRGDGDGGFEPVSGAASGIAIYGEQRGAAVSDFDLDGRSDLVVTQNGASTTLLKNRAATPGVQVRLVGPLENRLAIGAVIRPQYGDGTLGPARIVSAGSGYWSQSSAMQVVGAPVGRSVGFVQVSWPDGRVTTSAVPTDSDRLVIQYPGEL